MVKEEQAGSVLVDRVASAAAEQEVGAEAALLVGNGLRVLCVQLNLPTVAQTKVGRLSSTQKTERLNLAIRGKQRSCGSPSAPASQTHLPLWASQ